MYLLIYIQKDKYEVLQINAIVKFLLLKYLDECVVNKCIGLILW